MGEGAFEGDCEMNRCLPGRQGKGNKGKAFQSKEKHERRHRGKKLHVLGGGEL